MKHLPTSTRSNAATGEGYAIDGGGRSLPARFCWRRIGFAIPLIGFFAILSCLLTLTLAAGCADKKAPPATSPAAMSASTGNIPTASALDVTPAAEYTPPRGRINLAAIPDPVVTQTPAFAADSPAPSLSAAPGSVVVTSYTVQKGDTLYKIAKTHYGDGKQWNRIVAANPGVSPATLKAGQKLLVP